MNVLVFWNKILLFDLCQLWLSIDKVSKWSGPTYIIHKYTMHSSSLYVIYCTSYNPFLHKCIIKHFFLRSGKNIIREGQAMGGFLISKTFSIYCHYVISCLFPDDECVFQTYFATLFFFYIIGAPQGHNLGIFFIGIRYTTKILLVFSVTCKLSQNVRMRIHLK